LELRIHSPKRDIIILKLDFEKAFDTIKHSTIIQVMTHLGLPSRWLNWVHLILSSGSSAVLLNGVPDKFFKCKRGVWQGDSLSPLLFVLAAELLQVLINKAASMDLLRGRSHSQLKISPLSSIQMTRCCSSRLTQDNWCS
jgi:hypothetical protein